MGNYRILEADDRMNKCVVLMPAPQYRIKNLYEYVGSIEGVDSRVFKDARIGCNLSLAESYKNRANKYTYRDILLACSDKEYSEYYKWNIEHDRNIVIKRADNILFTASDSLSPDLDFIETARCGSTGSGGGFGPGGYGYKWNVTKTDLNNGRIAYTFIIHFNTKPAKDNFAKWWYYGKKEERLASKVVMGVPLSSISGIASFVIPQIDWENISNSPLWKAGNYDEAVLNEMGLKIEKGVIVKC